jgi:hypothetical protein
LRDCSVRAASKRAALDAAKQRLRDAQTKHEQAGGGGSACEWWHVWWWSLTCGGE